MKTLPQKFYRILVNLHPASFRSDFAHEMASGFEDALQIHGVAALYADAFFSLARQWAVCFFPGALQRRAALHPSLLSGHYVMLAHSKLTPFDLLRGFVLSLALFLSFGNAVSPVTFHSIFGYLHALL